MKVKLRKGRSAAQKDIAALQERIGEELPAEFIEFIESNDGAEADINIFKIDKNNSGTVTRFIPASQIPEEMAFIETLPEKAFPIAWDTSGNYVFIDQGAGGAVFFWDHELPHKPIKLAESFSGFLETLEPFDLDSIKLKPGQVKSVWVDPEFLKSLEKGSK